MRQKTSFPIHGKIVFIALAIALLTTCLLNATSVGTAQAKMVTKAKTGLTLDCIHISASAKQYAIEHGYCSKKSPDVTQPYNTVSGDCGTSSLFITDNYNGGYPTITVSAASSLGYMAYVSWHVKWVNHTTGGQNGYGGGQVFIGDNWSRSDNPYTGVGNIYAIMDNLTVTLAWGAYCTGNNPSASQY